MKKVIVAVPTYNHEKYIEQALNSIVQQQVDDFQMEVVVFDDGSTDRTPDICRRFQSDFPFVHYYPSEKNLGIEANGRRILAKCKGDFIAFCDGDDYWTDNRKLSKQMKIFSDFPGVSAVYHNVRIVTENRPSKNIYTSDQPVEIGFDDLMKGHFMKTSSLILRNRQHLFDPIVFGDLPADDTSLCFLILEDGTKGFFINEVMAVYRIHRDGVWSTLEDKKKLEWSALNLGKYIDYYRSRRDVRPLWKKLIQTHRSLMEKNLRELKLGKAFIHFLHFGNSVLKSF